MRVAPCAPEIGQDLGDVGLLDFAPGGRGWRGVPGRRKPERVGIESEDPGRLGGGVAKLISTPVELCTRIAG